MTEFNPKPDLEYIDMSRKQVIGAPLVIDGRVLSLSRAKSAGDFVFVTGLVPMRDGKPMLWLKRRENFPGSIRSTPSTLASNRRRDRRWSAIT
jgi:hypothetical protein